MVHGSNEAARLRNFSKLKLISSRAPLKRQTHPSRVTDAWKNFIPNSVQWCHPNFLSYKSWLPPGDQEATCPNLFSIVRSKFEIFFIALGAGVKLTSGDVAFLKISGGTTDAEVWYSVNVGGMWKLVTWLSCWLRRWFSSNILQFI